MSETDMQKMPTEVVEGLKKLGLKPSVWERPITPEEIQYLLDHCPFLQIVSSNVVDPLAEPVFFTAQSGWVVHNYGDAMSSSPGHLLFGGGDFRMRASDEEDDGDDGGVINPGKGTVWKQAFDTAAEMVELAKQLGWKGVQIIDGHPAMKWAAWMKASDERLGVDGYTPSERELAKRARVKRSEVDDHKLRQGMKQGR